jgi:multiple sugar transport system permease protein
MSGRMAGRSARLGLLRDAVAVVIVGLLLFPVFWWVLASFKPYSAIFANPPVFFDFTPTLRNYGVTLLGQSRMELAPGATAAGTAGGAGSYFSLPSIVQSIIAAGGSTLLALALATPAAFALSRFGFRVRRGLMFFVLGQRMLPPVAVAIPLFFVFRDLGLRDTLLGLVLAHTLINLPVATLLMKSFFDDIPLELDSAAMIDGAGRLDVFRHVALPLVRGGLAATAVLCFVFSWTEFLISLQLTSEIRTVPVKISTFVTSTGTEWGFITALGTAALVPAFVFILATQRHLVRGLSLGSIKE